LGYANSGDFEIDFSEDKIFNNNKAIIKPTTVYNLLDDIFLPVPFNPVSKMYLLFIADEFERIKNRAIHALNTIKSPEETKHFACNNLQNLVYLFRESKNYFHKLCSDNNSKIKESDLYLLYTLNFMIIHTITFYEELFSLSLNRKPANETLMRAAFKKEIPRNLKYSWLYNYRPSVSEAIDAYESINGSENNKIHDVIAEYSKKHGITNEIIAEALEFYKIKGILKLNGNINALAGEFYYLRYVKTVDGKPFIEGSTADFAKALSGIMLDKKGNQIKPDTIKSDIKPSNPSKRPSTLS
jgi:hypothetical protein